MLKKILAVIIFLLVCRSALAIEYLGIENTIRGKVVDVHINILSNEDETEFKVFGDVANMTSNSDCTLKDSSIICKNINRTNVNIRFQSFNTIQASDNSYKLFQQFLLPPTNRLTSLVTLPVGSVVANVSDAVYPKKYSMLSNGRNIMVYWELENVSGLQPVAFQVYFQSLQADRRSRLPYVLIIILTIALFSAAIGFRKSKAKTEIKPEKVVLKVLDSYERKIFEIVKKAGSIKQGKIVELTGISKAKVSRVVKSLESKGLLKTERRGRTKLLMLKKRLFR